jgi:DNA polymerase-3 subunit gamma/tau
VRGVLTEASRLFDELRFAAEPRLALELALIGLIRGKELTIEALAERVARLEQGGVPMRASAPDSSRAPARPRPEQAKSAEPVRSAETARKPEPAKSPAAPRAAIKSPAGGANIDRSEMELSWPEILKNTRMKKLSLGAFLVEGRPGAVIDGCLELVFPPKSSFARQELAKAPNAKLFREALAEVLGVEVNFTTAAGQETAAPKRAEPPRENRRPEIEDKASAASDMPADAGEIEDDMMDLLRESFGAEVVD